MSAHSAIPQSWITVPIEEIGETVTGTTPAKADPRNYGADVPFVKPPSLMDEVLSDSNEWLSHAGAKIARVIPAQSVLVTCIGNLGRTALSTTAVAINQQINAIIPALNIEPKFLLYQAQSPLFREQLNESSSATTIAIVNKGNFKKILVNISPLPEQRRIVAKIEELFSELDKAVQSLTTARDQLKAYRQSLLKNAFEGKLTTDWRFAKGTNLPSADELNAFGHEEARQSGHPLQFVADSTLKSLPAVPSHWRWVKLGSMTSGAEYGTSSKSAKIGKVPVIRMGNLQDAKIDWSDLVFTDDLHEIMRYALKAGDVLFNRTNSPELVGKTAIYESARPAIFAGYLIRVNYDRSLVDGRYLNYFLNSPVARQYGNTVKTDGVNQSNINAEKLQAYPFPLCSLEEQQEVADRLAAHLGSIDAFLAETERGLVRSAVLRRSILSKAFSGQLVAQNPNDEPTSVLLERIRAEREASASKPKKNTKRKRGEAA